MYYYNFPQQLNQKRLTLLLLSLVIPTDTIILQNIYKKKRELEIYDYKNSENWSIMADRGREVLRKASLQIQALYPGFIMYDSEWQDRYIYTDPLVGIKIINHLFTYWVRDEKSGKIKDACEEKLTPFSVVSGNNSISCETFSETLSKFRRVAGIIEEYGVYGLDYDIYSSIDELNYDIGVTVEESCGKIRC
jgi:hypothetical protein